MKRNTVLFLGLLLFAAPPLARAADQSPMTTVKTAVNALLKDLRDPAFKNDPKNSVRRDRVRATIDSVFSYEQLSRRALGRNWMRFSPKQQTEFVNLFAQLLSSTYMDRILAYSGEKVQFLKEIPLTSRVAEVQTSVTSNGQSIPINYRLVKLDSGWKIYDVTIENVSLVQNYRNQFTSLLERDSPEKLLSLLRKKVGHPS